MNPEGETIYHKVKYVCEACGRPFIAFEQDAVPEFWRAKWCPYCRSNALTEVDDDESWLRALEKAAGRG